MQTIKHKHLISCSDTTCELVRRCDCLPLSLGALAIKKAICQRVAVCLGQMLRYVGGE